MLEKTAKCNELQQMTKRQQHIFRPPESMCHLRHTERDVTSVSWRLRLVSKQCITIPLYKATQTNAKYYFHNQAEGETTSAPKLGQQTRRTYNLILCSAKQNVRPDGVIIALKTAQTCLKIPNVVEPRNMASVLYYKSFQHGYKTKTKLTRALAKTANLTVRAY